MSGVLRFGSPATLTGTLAGAVGLALVVGGGPAGAVSETWRADVPAAAAVAAAETGGSTTRVLAISVDGLNPTAIKQLGPDEAPNFYRLIDDGASTLNARTAVEQTVTLPNHTGMVTGRRIAKAGGGHGVTWNQDRRRRTVHEAAGHRVSSVFNVVHKAGRGTALFAGKPKFALFNRSWNKAIDRFHVDERQARLVRAVRRDLVDHERAFTFLHVALPDKAGHEHGFMSDKYLAAVQRTDELLGTILATIDSQPALGENLVVLLTADHGGKGANHTNQRRLANYRIPFLAWGPGVPSGNLYDLNDDYENPGKGRPSYAGAQPVRNADVANLATDLLGLGAVPGSEFDAAQDLDVE